MCEKKRYYNTLDKANKKLNHSNINFTYFKQTYTLTNHPVKKENGNDFEQLKCVGRARNGNVTRQGTR